MAKQFQSWSQHADDYIAWQLVGKPKRGIVVEVGAFDGVHLSNSYSLEQLGWQAICIEPNPRIFQFLRTQRPNAININKAIVGKEDIDEVVFYDEEIGVLSGVSYDEKDIKKRYKNRGLEYREPNKITVAAATLTQVLDEHLNNPVIDVVSIDVEGLEVEVLKGLDLDKYEVKLFIIEANTDAETEAILRFFKKHRNYYFIGTNRQNLFLLNRKYAEKGFLRNLDFENYQPATQKHPIDDKLTLQSVPPKFRDAPGFKKLQKRYWFW
ncbi:FkbM family methyltransferase [Luteirhabdus pelagi]|uniref:FkbM family methyltransferase n=1 Tax=Luteirhabdus pelagi TaxID=2792783 RepID=UPI0019397D68|nr:FkbM family methyltransferase [Luteirhabdus pelagi]